MPQQNPFLTMQWSYLNRPLSFSLTILCINMEMWEIDSYLYHEHMLGQQLHLEVMNMKGLRCLQLWRPGLTGRRLELGQTVWPLRMILRGIYLLGHCSEKDRALSALRIISQYLARVYRFHVAAPAPSFWPHLIAISTVILGSADWPRIFYQFSWLYYDKGMGMTGFTVSWQMCG